MNGEPEYPSIPTCGSTGKLSHATKQAAEKAAKRLGHFAYFCKECSGWHTTNVRSKKQRPFVRKRRNRYR